MDYYDIISLIIYLNDQARNDYKGVREILSVVHSKEIPEEMKGQMFLEIFRRDGLDEPLYVNNCDDPQNGVPEDIPGEVHWKSFRSGPVQLDLYLCQLANGPVRFAQILN